jgi:hypothetical protein
VTQAAAPCSFTISPTSIDVAAAGGDGQANVTAGQGCAWTATPSVGWITISAGASGTGGGTVQFSVSANTGGARSGQIAVGGAALTISQAAVPCTLSISPAGQIVGAAGGGGTVTISTGDTCGWTAASNRDWLTVTSGAAGTGSGSVSFSVAANTGAQRTGALTIGSQTFTVTQDAPCAFAIDPSSLTIGAAGSAGTLTVTTTASCGWSASSNNVDWLTVTSGSSGTGSGQVAFSAAANSGVERVGTITVAGLTFTLTQSAQ